MSSQYDDDVGQCDQQFVMIMRMSTQNALNGMYINSSRQAHHMVTLMMNTKDDKHN